MPCRILATFLASSPLDANSTLDHVHQKYRDISKCHQGEKSLPHLQLRTLASSPESDLWVNWVSSGPCLWALGCFDSPKPGINRIMLLTQSKFLQKNNKIVQMCFLFFSSFINLRRSHLVCREQCGRMQSVNHMLGFESLPASLTHCILYSQL